MTFCFHVQIEAMIAAGPHGRLDEYLPTVDLLLSVRSLLHPVGYARGAPEEGRTGFPPGVRGSFGTPEGDIMGAPEGYARGAPEEEPLAPDEEGVEAAEAAEGLLQTALDDLEFEFRDILACRS